MISKRWFAVLLVAISATAQNSIVNAVRAAIAQNDIQGAERMVMAFQARTGPRSDLAAALSWIARAHLAAKALDRADQYAGEASRMAARLLGSQKLDDDPWLPTAVGAAIEVHGQALAARGERAEALAYLREQLQRYASTSIAERIGKNINLLNLEGKPAPALEAAEWIGTERPATLASLRGRPVLLFFWAHWCSDCKKEVEVVANLRRAFAVQRLAVIAPTRLYGYVAGGIDAPPHEEKNYIAQVRKAYYSALAGVPAPLSASNFVKYGASSTPTLVLIDGSGIVRWYHPGSASEAELAERIRKLSVR
jgi:cytochrome c biogenesis protein CcmG/thiol:disulfide interchange protein DsbE